jgi:MarR family transcriptional regulator, lower aerobic nicotinate degradation pathway regulator
MLSPMSPTDAPQPPRRRSRRTDLGIVDALVQSSFLIHTMLSDLAGEHDLSITQTRLLGVLRDREPRMAHLAALLGLSKQSATGLVDRAEGRGLVARVTIPVGDERAVHVSLTDEGHALAREIAAQASRRVAAVVADLSPADRKRLSALLSRLVLRGAEVHGTDLSARPGRSATWSTTRP